MPPKGKGTNNKNATSTKNPAPKENKIIAEFQLKREEDFNRRLVSKNSSLKEEKENRLRREEEYQYAISETENKMKQVEEQLKQEIATKKGLAPAMAPENKKLQNDVLKLEEQIKALKNEYQEACRSWEAKKAELVENFAATNTAGNEILYENHRLQKEIQDFKYKEYGLRKDHIGKKARLENENKELKKKIEQEKDVHKSLCADKTHLAYQKEFLVESLENATQKYEESSEKSGQILGRLIGIRDDISDLYTDLSKGRSELNAATDELKDVVKIESSEKWQQMKKRPAVDIYT